LNVHNLLTISCRDQLVAVSIGELRADVVATDSAANKRALGALVLSIGFVIPHVVDVQWRVDHHVRSGICD